MAPSHSLAVSENEVLCPQTVLNVQTTDFFTLPVTRGRHELEKSVFALKERPLMDGSSLERLRRCSDQ